MELEINTKYWNEELNSSIEQLKQLIEEKQINTLKVSGRVGIYLRVFSKDFKPNFDIGTITGEYLSGWLNFNNKNVEVIVTPYLN